VSNYAQKNGSKKAFQKFYSIQTLTYGAFAEFIHKNKLKASKDDIIDEHAHDHHDHDHSHVHGSFLSRI
jgi:ABC-type Zn2+ transport system substrate-binding protein/surface adhesin